MAIEKPRHDEMQERPELCHGVLNRGTSEQQAVARVELKENLPSPTQVILDSLGFIQDHVMPFDSEKLLLVFGLVHDQVIGGKQNIDPHVGVVEIFRVKEFAKLLSLFWRTKEGEDFECRTEFVELVLPV
jgi:hypothetical protein